jgi:signal transduction histidine kinase
MFLAVMVTLGGVLGWLSWQLIRQDRALAEERLRERLENAADFCRSTLSLKLSKLDQQLESYLQLSVQTIFGEFNKNAGEFGNHAVLGIFADNLTEGIPANRILYYPHLPIQPGVKTNQFAQFDVMEFQKKQYDKAIAGLKTFITSGDKVVSAESLVRLGRILRKTKKTIEALQIYDELSRFESIPVQGLPSGLIARSARCSILDELGQSETLGKEATELVQSLLSAKWRIDLPTFNYYLETARTWLTEGEMLNSPDINQSFQLTKGFEAAYKIWEDLEEGSQETYGQKSLLHIEEPIYILWRGNQDKFICLVGGPVFLQSELLEPLNEILDPQSFRVNLLDEEGQSLFNRSVNLELPKTITMTQVVSRLPWTLQITNKIAVALSPEEEKRRNLIFIGIAVIGVLSLSGVYFIFRAVKRELEVAQIQSEFVSTVSHEFRTPLTSIRQLSEMLVSGRVQEKNRNKYYEILEGESKRLHHLVENVLDFRKMEAGAREYFFEKVSGNELVTSVVQDLETEFKHLGYEIETSFAKQDATIYTDKNALSQALRNLLENAMKYSPECKTIQVRTQTRSTDFGISVHDRGIGISSSEQKAIFNKFVRGSASETTGAKGTGLGLTLVKQIVEAHNGLIELKSEPGIGSTFTILIPLEQES